MIKLKKQNRRVVTALSLAIGVALAVSGCSKATPESHVLEARQYIDAGDVPAAVIAYKNAVQLAPQDPAIRFELGQLYIESRDFASAEKELNKALELGHPAGQVVPLLSLAYQQTGAENALASMDTQGLSLTAVEQAEVNFYKLQALVQLEKDLEARVLIEDTEALDTSSVYKGLVSSFKAVLDEDYERALELTALLREQAPLNKDVMLQYARLSLFLSKPEQAIDVYRNYVKTYPDDIQNKFTLAALLVEQQQFSDAEVYVDQLLALNDLHPLLNQYKGFILADEQNYEGALQAFETAIQQGRNDPALWLTAGFSAYQQQDYPAVIRYMSMIASELPENHAGLRMLADAQLKEGQSDSATSILKRITGKGDGDASLFSMAGYQLVKEGKLKDAQSMIDRSSEVSTTAEDLARLGVLQLSMNDLDGLVTLEDAVGKSEENANLRRILAQAYLSGGQQDKAQELIVKWQQDEPSDYTPWLLEMQLALQNQDNAKAEAALAKAKAVAPDSEDVKFAEVNYAISQQDLDKAYSLNRELLKAQPSNLLSLAVQYAIAREQGDTKAALEDYKTQYTNAQDNLGLRLGYAKALLVEGRSTEVAELLLPIEGDRTTQADFWSVKGQALLQTNQLREAEAHYNSWLSYYPSDRSAVLGKLLIDDVQGKFEDALALVRATRAQRQDTQFALLEAHFLAVTRKADEAQRILDAQDEGVLALPFVKGISARLHILKGEFEAAIGDAIANYEANPNTRNMAIVLTAYEGANQQQKAYEFLAKHTEAAPEDTAALMLFAERTLQKQPSDAIEMYKKAVEQTPRNHIAFNNLAYLQLQEGQLDDALQSATRAVELQPTNPDTLDTLGQIQLAMGNMEAALKTYEKITDIVAVRNEEVYVNYIELLLKSDQRRLAERRIKDRSLTRPDMAQRLESLKREYQL